MHKQKPTTEPFTKLHGIALQAGAWVLTAAALMAATEKLHHLEAATAAVPVQGHSTHANAHQPEAIRAEGARETARLPEEYDVGLRMPGISGL